LPLLATWSKIHEKPAPKLQQKWSKEVHVAAARKLRLDDALGDSDLVHADARARPAAYILQAKLSNPFFRFSPADFIAWFCFQFRIPQQAHLGNADAAGVEQWLGSCRRRNVHLHGNHAHRPCKVCLRGRGHRHRYLKNVVSHYATKASCIASWVREDSTSELLLRQVTPMQCSTMFPLKAPAALADGARQMLTDLRAVVVLPIDEHEAKLVELDEQLQALRGSVVDGHGLRLDGTCIPRRASRFGSTSRLCTPPVKHTSRARSIFRTNGVWLVRRALTRSQRP
jgi:hypothetical protein